MKKTILSLFATLLLAMSVNAQGVSVMSFNIGEDSPAHSWSARSDAVAGMIVSESPDVIGLQACPASVRKDLEKSLPGYSCVELSKRGASDNLILYRSSESSVLESGFFSLGDKPEKAVSKFSCSTQSCSAVWAVLKLQNGKEVLVIDTSFDENSAEARTLQARLILEKAASLSKGRPCILTGTFFCKPSLWSDKDKNGPGNIFKSSRLLDARQMALGTDSKPSFTAWGTESKLEDYIFYSVDGLSANQFRTIAGPEPLSSHSPIRANLLFK